MAAIALTNSTSRNISPVFLDRCKIRSHIAAVAISAGQLLYVVTASGRVNLASAAAANALAVCIGIALKDGGVGQAIDVLEEGFVDGFEISALSYGVSVYLSDTAGTLATTAGTVSTIVGKVEAVSDKDPATSLPSKLVYFKSNFI